jgi:hypothetical protein
LLVSAYATEIFQAAPGAPDQFFVLEEQSSRDTSF